MALASINIKFTTDLKGFSTGMQNASRSINKMGRDMKKMGKSMSKYLTAPIVGMGVMSVKTFADFEQSMAKVKAVSGATATQFKALTDNAKKLGASTRYTASEVSNLQLNYSKLGFSAEEIEKVTGATLDLALATGEDLATSATVAASTLRGFGLEASQMNEVVDVMAKSFSSSALDLEKFKTAMGVLAPVAKNAGVSLQQATGYLSILVDRGVDASTAGTGLRNMFLNLAKSGMTLDEAMAKINNSTNKNAVALQLFGKRGATVATIMAENATEANSLAQSYYNSAGAAKAMAGIMDNTLQGSLFKLKSAFEGLMIEIGENLKPLVQSLAGFLANLAQKFQQLSPDVKRVAIAIAGIAAAVGPLLIIAGTVLPALVSGFALLTGPIGLIVAGIGAITFAVIKYFPEIKKAVADVANYFVDLYNESAAVRIGIEFIKFAFKATWDFLKMGLKNLVALFKGFGQVLKGVFTFDWDTVKKGFTDFTNSVNDNMSEFAKSIGQDFTDAIENVKHNKIEFVADVTVDADQIQTEISKKTQGPNKPVVSASQGGHRNKRVEGIEVGNLQGVVMGARKMVADLKPVLQESKEMMIDWSDEMSSAIQGAVSNFAIGLGEMLGDFMSGNATFAKIGGLMVSSIVGLLKALGEAAIKIGVGMIAVKAAFTNPFTAIAAGVAMIALSSLMETAFADNSRPMADGGIAYTPTHALIGEYANARRDPEVVAPLSKLKNMLGGIGGTQSLMLAGEFKLRGQDMVLAIDRENKRQNRTRG